MSEQPLISAVAPFLDEADALPEFYRRLKTALNGLPERHEIIFVDDGSRDGSAAWAAKTAASDNAVRLVRLTRNFGHQAAITAGLDAARGDAIVIIDADLQDPPELIPAMLEKWRRGFQVVYAKREARKGESFAKKLAAAAFYRLFNLLSDTPIPADTGDFRLLGRQAADAVISMRETHRFMRGMSAWAGFSQCAVEYERQPRAAGETKYPFLKSLALAWDAVTSFSGAPLRLTAGLGFLTAAAGLMLAARIIWGKIFHPEMLVQGWTSLMAVVLVTAGAQLVAVGILGQYLSRVFEETKRRPLYVVSEKLGFK